MGPPCSDAPRIRAGAVESASIARASVRRPGSTSSVSTAASAVSRPIVPGGDLVELRLLLLDGVRGVIRGDRVDRAVREAGAQRVSVLGAADRRVHLQVACRT